MERTSRFLRVGTYFIATDGYSACFTTYLSISSSHPFVAESNYSLRIGKRFLISWPIYSLFNSYFTCLSIFVLLHTRYILVHSLVPGRSLIYVLV